MRKVLIVAATKMSKVNFERYSYLGLSLRRLSTDPAIESAVCYENTAPLANTYNQLILEPHHDKLLLFVHDDVWIDDYWLSTRLEEALSAFDVIGLAGNTRQVPGQPAWAFPKVLGQWDSPENLSGRVCHLSSRLGEQVSVFGPSGKPCKLLDGCFLAARADRLLEQGIKFDPQFAFHFYDMDFCRAAEECGLALGTWPIAITHASGGAFGSPEWKTSYELYQRKWKD
jgi:GT2 family glycosyltransferase